MGKSTRQGVKKNTQRETATKKTEVRKPEEPIPGKPYMKVPKPQPKPAKTTLDNRMRYSDEDLKEFKDLIEAKIESAKNEIRALKGYATDEKTKDVNDSAASMEREGVNSQISRQVQYVKYLQEALVRIENKTYGVCRETGKLISKERLRAVPHATLSMEAKTQK